MLRIDIPSRRSSPGSRLSSLWASRLASFGPLALAALTAIVTTGGCQEKTSQEKPSFWYGLRFARSERGFAMLSI